MKATAGPRQLAQRSKSRTAGGRTAGDDENVFAPVRAAKERAKRRSNFDTTARRALLRLEWTRERLVAVIR
jgi:hypothetical protein